MNHFIKRLFIILLLLIFTSSIAMASVSLEEVTGFVKKINIKIQDAPAVSTQTILSNNRIYVPLRFIAETLNASIFWDKQSNILTIQNKPSFKDFEECDPWKGELFVYGEICAIDKINRQITVEQHIDDNSISIEPGIEVAKDVVIILQRNDKKMNIDFHDLKVGDQIGLVLTDEGIARGIILAD
ncbi:stalk domain-containing protein [Clostridiaceae bacterium 35-E11]